MINLPINAFLIARSEAADEGVEVDRIKVVPESWPALSDTIVATIGNGIEIVQAEMSITEGEVDIDIEWQVRVDQNRSFTTFVHLGRPGEAPLATGDSTPRQGFYPTSLWRAGERFTDSYTLILPEELPAEPLSFQIGLYDPVNGARLPLSVGGERQAFDGLVVGEWER
ncbi:MAG: hypothetical protein AAF633_07795 [Chloroflexota bacterium]